MPYSPQFVLVFLAAAGLYFSGKAVVHGVNTGAHTVCHVVTLGKKCKPKQSKPLVQPNGYVWSAHTVPCDALINGVTTNTVCVTPNK